VPGKNLLVQVSLDLNNQEMGQDAFSDVSPRGSRPKKLTVALTLPYSQPEALQALLAIAEAVGGKDAELPTGKPEGSPGISLQIGAPMVPILVTSSAGDQWIVMPMRGK
jgi:hypothetical protein